MFMKSKSFAAAAALSIAASGSFAQGQEGLVNISVDDNTVQVPVGVAANVCDLDVNVLASQFVGSNETACEIDQETAAENGIGTGSNGGSDNGQQEGLVNVSVDDNTVQVPVGVAANVCDLDVNVLASQFVGSDETACEIDQETAAENGIGSGSNGGSGNGQQEGLVNLSVDGNTVQVPVGVAANVCDVDANVIAEQTKGTEESVCEIDQETAAENGIDAPVNDAADTDEDDAEDGEEAAEEAQEDLEETAEDANDD